MSRSANRRRTFDDLDRARVFEQQRRRRRAVMRQRDVDAALVEQAHKRKVRARCRLDVVNRAARAPRLEEHAVRVVAERERAGDVFGKIRAGDQPRHRPGSGITLRAMLSSIAPTRAVLDGNRPAGRAAHAAMAAGVRQLEVEPEELHEPSKLTQVRAARTRSGRSSSASVLTSEGYQLSARSAFASRSQRDCQQGPHPAGRF